MPRPPRQPGTPAVRLTIYVSPDTKRLLTEHAAATFQSPGEIVDKLIIDLADGFTIAPGTFHAGQPGVEHRATAVVPAPAVARHHDSNTIVTGLPTGTEIETGTFYDHPGWKLSATGQNICTRCGKSKSRSRNASCKPPT